MCKGRLNHLLFIFQKTEGMLHNFFKTGNISLNSMKWTYSKDGKRPKEHLNCVIQTLVFSPVEKNYIIYAP